MTQGLGVNNVVLSQVTEFVPGLWSNEVVASYKSNIVMAQLVRRLNHRGKKGNSITIPNPLRGNASAKVAGTQVNLIPGDGQAGINITISKQYEYSRLIEDIVSVQALGSLRQFYTDDGGYAIAKQIDKDLINVAAANGSAGTTGSTEVALDASGNISAALANAYIGDMSANFDQATANATDLSDVGIRRIVRALDKQDAPMRGRHLVVTPNVKADLIGQPRFTEQAFTGEKNGNNTIRNGLVGNVYAMDVYVTNQLFEVDNAAGTATVGEVLLAFQSDALLLIEQAGVRTQRQYKQEWLADLFTADVIYGVGVTRPSSIIPVVVPLDFTDG